MPFRTIRADSARRLTELQNIFRVIASSEAARPVPVEHASNKGLFVVALYSFMEFSVTSIVRSAADHINSLQVRHNDLMPDVIPLVCDPLITAVKDARGEKKWRKVHEMTLLSHSATICKIRDGILSTELMNTGFSTITLIFSLFAVQESPAQNTTVERYLDEIRERRNAVAHGRESASEVGGRYSAADLEDRLRQFENQVTHMIFSFEASTTKRLFIKDSVRAKYP